MLEEMAAGSSLDPAATDLRRPTPTNKNSVQYPVLTEAQFNRILTPSQRPKSVSWHLQNGSCS